MLTPTHTLLSCGLLTARNSTARNLAVLAGGVVPDLPMAGLFIYDRYVQGLGEELALCFASHGAKLILSARNRERLEVSATH